MPTVHGNTEAVLADLAAKGLLGPRTRTATSWTGIIPERDFQSAVEQFARRCGWLIYHTRDSRKSVAGFPDLILIRDRLLVRELKTDTGQVMPDQQTWLEAFKAAGVDAGVWRPGDWPTIERTLR
jgi:hypothetical protein